MTPEQAAQQREAAYTNALLALRSLTSSELDPSRERPLGILEDLRLRIAAIERAEFDSFGGFAPGGAAIPRGAPLQRPPAGSREEQVAAVQAEMAQRGIGRL